MNGSLEQFVVNPGTNTTPQAPPDETGHLDPLSQKHFYKLALKNPLPESGIKQKYPTYFHARTRATAKTVASKILASWIQDAEDRKQKAQQIPAPKPIPQELLDRANTSLTEIQQKEVEDHRKACIAADNHYDFTNDFSPSEIRKGEDAENYDTVYNLVADKKEKKTDRRYKPKPRPSKKTPQLLTTITDRPWTDYTLHSQKHFDTFTAILSIEDRTATYDIPLKGY